MTQGSILEVSPKLLGGIKKKAAESTNNKGVVSVFCKIAYVIFVKGFLFRPKGNTFTYCFILKVMATLRS